jgi:catechol 2,3-dioxygenase-like lactoylglutathione lyase family enzyme
VNDEKRSDPPLLRVERTFNAPRQAVWYVPDLERVVDELGARGLTFERYDDPALSADAKGIHELGGGRVAWFEDPDGNTFAIEERAT